MMLSLTNTQQSAGNPIECDDEDIENNVDNVNCNDGDDVNDDKLDQSAGNPIDDNDDDDDDDDDNDDYDESSSMNRLVDHL